MAGTVRADTADMVHAVDAASNEPRALNESGRLLAWSRHARALVRTRRRVVAPDELIVIAFMGNWIVRRDL